MLDLPVRRRGRVGHVWRQAASLSARVTVNLVIVAHVEEICVTLGCRAQALQANVRGATITRETDHEYFIIQALCFEGCDDAGCRRCRGFERGMDHVDI